MWGGPQSSLPCPPNSTAALLPSVLTNKHANPPVWPKGKTDARHSLQAAFGAQHDSRTEHLFLGCQGACGPSTLSKVCLQGQIQLCLK